MRKNGKKRSEALAKDKKKEPLTPDQQRRVDGVRKSGKKSDAKRCEALAKDKRGEDLTDDEAKG